MVRKAGGWVGGGRGARGTGCEEGGRAACWPQRMVTHRLQRMYGLCVQSVCVLFWGVHA